MIIFLSSIKDMICIILSFLLCLFYFIWLGCSPFVGQRCNQSTCAPSSGRNSTLQHSQREKLARSLESNNDQISFLHLKFGVCFFFCMVANNEYLPGTRGRNVHLTDPSHMTSSPQEDSLHKYWRGGMQSSLTINQWQVRVLQESSWSPWSCSEMTRWWENNSHGLG